MTKLVFKLCVRNFSTFFDSSGRVFLIIQTFQLAIQVKVKTFVFDFAKSKDAKEYQSMIEDVNKLEVGILVNNVGTKYTHPEPLHGMKDDLSDISNIIAVNTMPVTLLTSALLPQMVQRKGGVVVNISSFSGLYPMSHWSVYSSTKQYVRWLSNILRQEYARKGVIVQTICPVFVVTNLTKVDWTPKVCIVCSA